MKKRTYGDGVWIINYRNADGQLHRTDGPAYKSSYGTEAYHLDGEMLTEIEHAERVAAMTKTEEEFIIDDNGNNMSCTIHFGNTGDQTATINGKRYRIILEEIIY